MVRVKLTSCVCTRRHALTHLKERIHLLLGAHLTAQYAVGAQVVWLMQIRIGSDAEATHTLPTAHDAATLTLKWRWLVDRPATERVRALSRTGATNYLRGWLGTTS